MTARQCLPPMGHGVRLSACCFAARCSDDEDLDAEKSKKGVWSLELTAGLTFFFLP